MPIPTDETKLLTSLVLREQLNDLAVAGGNTQQMLTQSPVPMVVSGEGRHMEARCLIL